MTMIQPSIESPTRLIFAGTVDGTPVFSAHGERVGHVEDLAIDKISGQVAYAILSVGGFLGMGEKRHPVPWTILTYDVIKNGYVVALDMEQLRRAPAYDRVDLADIGNKTIADHWGPFI
jgi:sporulation protein YlmC with PRC-barrel domain